MMEQKKSMELEIQEALTLIIVTLILVHLVEAGNLFQNVYLLCNHKIFQTQGNLNKN